ncbi:MAG: hypothetical protein IKL84_05790 [Clostridia bacterium]|nr:hypothetical protein [Clostridia bacterium]
MISFFCGMLLAAGGFAIACAVQSKQADRLREAAQFRAVTDAVGYLAGMSDCLRLAVDGDRPLPHLIELRHYADMAGAALGEVRFTAEGGEMLRRFTACTAEFAGKMADELARGSRRTPDYELLIRLRDFAVPLTEEILPNALYPDSPAFDEQILSQYLSGLGRLYYDGVGSNVQPQSGYLSLVGRSPIGTAEAERLAEQIAGGKVNLRRIAVSGEPERYCFGCSNLTVTLTAVDGALLSLLHDRVGTDGDLGEEKARMAAEAAILQYAPEELEEVLALRGEGMYYFTFAPLRDGLLCLSERILVGIDAATARLNVWDADGYYRYFVAERWIPDNLISPEQAAAYLGIDSLPQLCTSVRADGREVICYCSRLGENAIYLNAVTGGIESVRG